MEPGWKAPFRTPNSDKGLRFHMRNRSQTGATGADWPGGFDAPAPTQLRPRNLDEVQLGRRKRAAVRCPCLFVKRVTTVIGRYAEEYGGVFTPEDLELLQQLFDEVCQKRGYAPDGE